MKGLRRRWFKFRENDSNIVYGIGTSDDAMRYQIWLNQHRTNANRYSRRALTIEETAAKLREETADVTDLEKALALHRIPRGQLGGRKRRTSAVESA